MATELSPAAPPPPIKTAPLGSMPLVDGDLLDRAHHVLRRKSQDGRGRLLERKPQRFGHVFRYRLLGFG